MRLIRSLVALYRVHTVQLVEVPGRHKYVAVLLCCVDGGVILGAATVTQISDDLICYVTVSFVYELKCLPGQIRIIVVVQELILNVSKKRICFVIQTRFFMMDVKWLLCMIHERFLLIIWELFSVVVKEGVFLFVEVVCLRGQTPTGR